MEKLRKLIKEALTNPPKKENCGCGGSCCKAPTLTEGKSSKLISENLAYHIDNKIPLYETVFRMGSEKHFELIKEARRLYSRGIIDISEDDKFIIESNLGEFGMYEGQKVPLDLPMVNEEYDGMDIYDQIANEEFGMDYDQLGPNEQDWVRDEIDNMELNEKKKGIDGKECWDGYRYAGTEKGKDKCVKVNESEIFKKGTKIKNTKNNRVAPVAYYSEPYYNVLRKWKYEEWHKDDVVLFDKQSNLDSSQVNESKPNTDEVVSILKKLDKDAASMLFKAYKDKSLSAQQVVDIARKTGNINEEMNEEWPDEVQSRYGEYIFKLNKVMPDRAKYDVIDVETGKIEIGGRIYGTPTQLQYAADDLIKPQGGTRSTQLGEAKPTPKIKEDNRIWSSYEQRMVNQIMRAKKDNTPIFVLPMKTQEFYRKYKDKFTKPESLNESLLLGLGGLALGALGTIGAQKGIPAVKKWYKSRQQDEEEKIKAAAYAAKKLDYKKYKQELLEPLVDYLINDTTLENLYNQLPELKNKFKSTREKENYLKKRKSIISTRRKILKQIDNHLKSTLSEEELKYLKDIKDIMEQIYKDPSKITDLEFKDDYRSDYPYAKEEIPDINIDNMDDYLDDEEINEAEYQGKDVDLNKPKRGGSKKFYVYVRDPKTKNIKKVSFGAKDGGQNLKVKFKDPEARKAFADRHNCDQKKDKTTPGFWSCNIPRYADLLGLGSKMNTYW